MEQKRPWGCGKWDFNFSSNQHFEKRGRRKCMLSVEKEPRTEVLEFLEYFEEQEEVPSRQAKPGSVFSVQLAITSQ